MKLLFNLSKIMPKYSKIKKQLKEIFKLLLIQNFIGMKMLKN